MVCSVWVVWTGVGESKEAMRVLLKSPCQFGKLSHDHAKAVHNCRSSHIFLAGRCSKLLTPAIKSMAVSCISYAEDSASLEYSEDPIDGTTHEWLLCGWDIPDGTRNHSCIQATFYRWHIREYSTLQTRCRIHQVLTATFFCQWMLRSKSWQSLFWGLQWMTWCVCQCRSYKCRKWHCKGKWLGRGRPVESHIRDRKVKLPQLAWSNVWMIRTLWCRYHDQCLKRSSSLLISPQM